GRWSIKNNKFISNGNLPGQAIAVGLEGNYLDGGTPQDNHEIAGNLFVKYAATRNTIIDVGCSCSLSGNKFIDCTAQYIINAGSGSRTIDYVEVTNNLFDVTLQMKVSGENGIRIKNSVSKAVIENNIFKLRPIEDTGPIIQALHCESDELLFI